MIFFRGILLLLQGILQTLRAPSTHKEIASFAVRRAWLLPHSLILHSDAYKNSLVFGFFFYDRDKFRKIFCCFCFVKLQVK